MKINDINWAGFTIVFGLILMFIFPMIWTIKASGFLDFSESGQIGDTIGGITAPIASLMGAILVFLSLKAQIEANRITQVELSTNKQVENIENRILFINEELERFYYYESTVRGNGFDIKGTKAVAKCINESFLKFLNTHSQNPKSRLGLFNHDDAKKLLRLLGMLAVLVEDIRNSELPIAQRENLLMQLEFVFEVKIRVGGSQINQIVRNPEIHAEEYDQESVLNYNRFRQLLIETDRDIFNLSTELSEEREND